VPDRPAALLLAPEAPYPVAGGGALRTASLVEYLGRRYSLDLVVFRQPGAHDPRDFVPPGLVRDIAVIHLPVNSRSYAARGFRNAFRMARRVPPLVDRFGGFGDQLAHAIAGRRYEVGVVEHSWCAPYLEQIAPCCQRTVLDLHNIESLLHRRCASSGGAGAVAHRVFGPASRKLEGLWLPRFGQVLAPSAEDAAQVLRIAPAARVSVYPNALPAQPRPPAAGEEAVVFSGNLEYHPNADAVRFFRREIWPLLRDRHPGLVWRLVGKNPQAVRKYTAGDPRIETTGPVDDAVAEIALARVAVVPLLSGSGTRLKILEAWAAGVPVVTTTIGGEGLPVEDGKTALVADSAPSFAAQVGRLLTCRDLCRDLGNAGRVLLEKEFTWENVWKKLSL
jgi:polysaccharide biosynthesis protein PslH